jgi:hypothetical protein
MRSQATFAERFSGFIVSDFRANRVTQGQGHRTSVPSQWIWLLNKQRSLTTIEIMACYSYVGGLQRCSLALTAFRSGS